ncbi:MAG: FAD binding domain-containing protein, partial [Phycisphaerales bacterium]
YHAIFGDGPCHIVHPSNLALGLAVSGAELELAGTGKRIKLSEFFHLPAKGVRTEHGLAPTEIVGLIHLSPAPVSAFYAIKEKQSFDWPLVMAGAALTMNGDKIASASIVAGAVAPVPHPLPKVAAALAGVRPADDAALRAAIAGCVEGAKPMTQNSYKLKLLPVAIRRAVLKAAGLLKEDHA